MQISLPRLDTRSALVGFGLAGTLFLLTAIAAPTPPLKAVRLNLDPDPAAIVRISEGQSYQVPPKLHLVLKAAVPTRGDGGVLVRINGELVYSKGGAGSELGAFVFPIVANAGDVVTVEEVFPTTDGSVYVTGYLALGF